MTRKLRILHVGEASFLATGYSVYAMEVMSRLQATGKYELAELACYVTKSDPRASQLPWKFYGNNPDFDNQHEVDRFNQKGTNQFGEYSFERVCLDFKPDIVWSIRDWWMDEFIERSPFRPYFRWVVMPTVDASPQHEQWLATYMNADAVFTYSDWGREILDKEGGGLINTQGSAPPGADLETFVPMDKKALRAKFRFEDDVQIIGTVMRNQGRKLYPELIESFAEFMRRAPAEMAKKTYLYLHTSYPDKGWDIPRLIKRYGVSSRVLVTYKCLRCKAVFPSFFMDATGPCMDCGYLAARMPNVQEGVDRSTLAKIINLFDVYVQYANSEGFGMPMVEAASCGVPVFATDYSAMSDVVRKVEGYPIRVDRYRMDNEFGCLRAIPDNNDLVYKWIKFFSLSDGQRRQKSQKARQGVGKHYTWPQTTNRWMRAFDSLMTSNTQSTLTGTTRNPSFTTAVVSGGVVRIRSWDSVPNLWQPKPLPKKSFDSNEDLVRWAISNVLGRPELTNSYLSVRLIRDLSWGLSMKQLSGGNYANEHSVIAGRSDMTPFGPEEMIRELTLMCENRNTWEQRRWQTIQGCE